MVINISSLTFKAIKTLLEEEVIKKSVFKNKKLLDVFIESNCVYIDGKPQQIYLNDKDALFGVINANGYKVNTIEDIEYFTVNDKQTLSRDEVTDKYSNTKRVESKSFNGLMISVFDKLEVKYNDEKQYFYPMEGTGLFIHYTSKLELNKDTILVGVENPQVVWYINRYKHLFDKNKKYIFLSLSEYKTSYQYKWLESFKGEYLHFGDFDLAGINIYLNTIIPKLKNCKKYSFLIPDDIYKIMKEKNYNKDYPNQVRYLNINTNEDTSLQELAEFIKDNKFTLEQEMLKL